MVKEVPYGVLLTALARAGERTPLVDCMPFLFVLLSGDDYLLLCVESVKRALTSESVDLRGDRSHELVGVVEPEVGIQPRML